MEKIIREKQFAIFFKGKYKKTILSMQNVDICS